MEIQGRSNQQIVEDDIVELHTQLSQDLRMLAGSALLYRGPQAKRMMEWRDRCEKAIANADSTEVTKHIPYQLGVFFYVSYQCYHAWR